MLDQSLVCFTNYFLYTLLGCFTYQHWLYPLLQCFCWCQNTNQVNVFNDTYSNHMGKGNKMSDFHFLSFRMICNARTIIGAFHQALSIYAFAVPLDLSIGSLRHCRADVNVRTPIKGVYLMRHIAAIWEKATTCCLWFSFSFVQDDLQCSTNHSSVSQSTFSIRYWGALLISIGFIRYCRADVNVRTPIKGVYLMRHSSHMGKGNKMLSVIFIFLRPGWFAIPDQS